ncbi:hypothetical protein [Pedobacter yulinensis]|nr:hypothetical protein [Pedobacter yulinensis]
MKTIILYFALVLGLAATALAQTKKTVKKSAATTKKAPATATTTRKAPAAKRSSTAVTKPQPASAQVRNNHRPVQSEPEASYKTALGVKFLWGIALTGKHFFSQKHGAEAIVRYHGYAGVGNDINLTLLYEYHRKFGQPAGLSWYLGGGAQAGNFTYKGIYNNPAAGNDSQMYYGVSGVAGLEYKFRSLPLAVSADWQPVFLLQDYSDRTGFAAENGGLGLKYTF